MFPLAIVLHFPGFDLLARIPEIGEPVLVQALVARLAVELGESASAVCANVD